MPPPSPRVLLQAMEFAQSKGNARRDGSTGVTFADVGGLGNTIKEMQEVVEVRGCFSLCVCGGGWLGGWLGGISWGAGSAIPFTRKWWRWVGSFSGWGGWRAAACVTVGAQRHQVSALSSPSNHPFTQPQPRPPPPGCSSSRTPSAGACWMPSRLRACSWRALPVGAGRIGGGGGGGL